MPVLLLAPGEIHDVRLQIDARLRVVIDAQQRLWSMTAKLWPAKPPVISAATEMPSVLPLEIARETIARSLLRPPHVAVGTVRPTRLRGNVRDR